MNDKTEEQRKMDEVFTKTLIKMRNNDIARVRFEEVKITIGVSTRVITNIGKIIYSEFLDGNCPRTIAEFVRDAINDSIKQWKLKKENVDEQK